VTWPDGREQDIDPATLRRQCRCAHCVEEMSGKPILDPSTVSEDIYPEHIQPMGHYAVSISWSDGHASSIYPYKMLAELPGQLRAVSLERAHRLILPQIERPAGVG